MGFLSVRTYGIKRRAPKRKRIRCQYCEEVCRSQRSLNNHMSTVHPTVSYKCRYCSKTYKTYNGRFKHMLIHKGYSFQCDVCAKTYPFKSRLDEHMRRHTSKGLLPCLSKGCKSKFTTKRAMHEHLKTHTTSRLFCDYPECADDKDGFRTKNYLRQHV